MRFLRLSILLLTVLSNVRAFAQNETNHWYFGYHAGLDFSGGAVVVDTTGAMFQLEGCAAVSDPNGDLLFYTNGVIVWDAQHSTMPNGTGLYGNYSATQSAAIVKKPFSDSLYYIFTVDAYSTIPVNGGFLSYSFVDMSLNSGWRDVTVKNELVYSVTGEKLTAVRHCNETDYWIISCRTGTNGIYAYLLTKDGLSNTPVISNIGSMWSNQREIGYLKATMEGDRLGAANKTGDMYEIMDFDRACGMASNPILLPLGTFATPGGLSFLPMVLICTEVAPTTGTSINTTSMPVQ